MLLIYVINLKASVLSVHRSSDMFEMLSALVATRLVLPLPSSITGTRDIFLKYSRSKQAVS